MIWVPPPHIVLNADDVPGPEYKMWRSWRVPKSHSPSSILKGVVTLAKDAPDGKVKTLIFNSHGDAGTVFLGTGITIDDVPEFAVLKGIVESIWIVACEVARARSIPDKPIEQVKDAAEHAVTSAMKGGFGGGRPPGIGRVFCSSIAKTAAASVTASKDTQRVDRFFKAICPFGYIDDWEGQVSHWGPSGV